MDADEFRKYGKQAIDFIADYIENIRERPVLPAVEPGYFQKMLPDAVPENGESFSDVFQEIDRLIMPGVCLFFVSDGFVSVDYFVQITHWHSPRFHAYYPAGNSYPSIIGEILDAGIGAIGFSWVSKNISFLNLEKKFYQVSAIFFFFFI